MKELTARSEHPLRIPRLMAQEESGGELAERLRQTPID